MDVGSIGSIGAIAISSAIFAGLHLAKPFITALLFAIGIACGLVIWQTGSFLVVAIAHTIYDIWALRHLNKEMVRLGLFSLPPPLANSAGHS